MAGTLSAVYQTYTLSYTPINLNVDRHIGTSGWCMAQLFSLSAWNKYEIILFLT